MSPPVTAKLRPVPAAPPTKVTAQAEPRSGEPRIWKTAAHGPSKGEFWVQVGAFKKSKYAARLAARLSAGRYPVVVRRGESAAAPHVVRVGRYPTREQAEEVQIALETKGFRGFILRDERH
ncbi:MAG: SPOR domain-containing protein [Candidatus Methylomirabilia bacterium]